jgi:formylglycine-generating enzyme required for sulfatase activity
MVPIPEGAYTMGFDKRWPDEGPQHVMYVGRFSIDRHEVTNAQYRKFVEATGRQPPRHWIGGKVPPGKENHPVTYVSWYDGWEYCHWVGKRLPVEEEWEKAARGTDFRLFPWGDVFDPKKANTPQSRLGDTTPVGSFPAGRSFYGLDDMSGNVWEWTASWYKPYSHNKRNTENYGERYRVVKGGSYVDCSFYHCGLSAPTFNRGFFKPETKNNGFGFRCAKSAS